MGGFCCMGWRGIDGVGGGGEGRRVGETYGFERRGTGEVGCYRGWGLGRLGEGGGRVGFFGSWLCGLGIC